MQIIVDRKIQSSQCLHLAEQDPLVPVPVTLPLERWLRERESLAGHDPSVGLRLLPADAVEALAPFVSALELIAIEFDKFAEGRGYSQAYLLRERLGYRGELRALKARRDHVMYMERCGFNAFEPAIGESAADLLAGFDEISVRYQPSHDRVPLIFRRRAGRSAATL